MNNPVPGAAEFYAMRVVTRLTGLSADTIRVWERRYQVVAPSRTNGNTRRYSAAEVRRLTLLREAADLGHKIGDIAHLAETDLTRLINQDNVATLIRTTGRQVLRATEAYSHVRSEYLEAIGRYDVRKASDIFARAATLLSSSDFIFKLIVPILKEAGDRWAADTMSVAQEHLITAQVRSLLDQLMRMSLQAPGGMRILVATPAGHRHEFGVLIGALIAASKGFETIYLGPDVPEKDLISAATISRADVLLLGVLRDMAETELTDFTQLLNRLSKTVDTWLGLPPQNLANRSVPGIRFLERFEDLDMALTERMTQAFLR